MFEDNINTLNHSLMIYFQYLLNNKINLKFIINIRFIKAY
jgi:hypothetical protein